MRTHVTPRPELFVPTTDSCSANLEWVDIFRRTQTSLDHGQLRELDDFWTADARSTPRILDEEWIGRSVFHIVPKPPLGKQWQDGRLTVIQPTTRPPNVWVEVWEKLTPNQQQLPIDAWKIEGPRREAEYKDANKNKVVEFKRYDQLLSEARSSLSLPPVPAMACRAKAQVNANISRERERERREFLTKIVPMICYTIIKKILVQLDSFLQLISPLFTKQCLVTKSNT